MAEGEDDRKDEIHPPILGFFSNQNGRCVPLSVCAGVQIMSLTYVDLPLAEDTWTEVTLIIKKNGNVFRVAKVSAVVIEQDNHLGEDSQYPVFNMPNKDK